MVLDKRVKEEEVVEEDDDDEEEKEEKRIKNVCNRKKNV